MKIYINTTDDKVKALNINDKFAALIDELEEGLPDYENLADEFVEVVTKKIPDAFEAYRDREDAENYFDPFYCF